MTKELGLVQIMSEGSSRAREVVPMKIVSKEIRYMLKRMLRNMGREFVGKKA
jgi:hypothetical protein